MKSQAATLDNFLTDLAGLQDTPFARGRITKVEKLTAWLLENIEMDDGDARGKVLDVAEEAFNCGFDFCLALQKALRAFADGDVEALRPFIPNPHVRSAPQAKAVAVAR